MAAPRPPRRPQVAPGEFPYDTKRTPPAPLLSLRVGLPQIGEVAVHGVGDAVRRVPVYAAELKAASWRGLVAVAGIGGESLLGRDVLNAWIVMLDGPRQTLRVKWD